jgi:deoxyribose-phosphate aldolase
MRQLKAAVSDKAVRSELQEDLSNFNDAVKERDQGVCTKLILECCYLTDEEKVLGCRLAKAAGFDFVKTSTGFGTGGATVHDVKLMRRTVGKKMGVKAAGGIRTLDDALKFIDAGASRLGCSAGVSIIEELA